MVDRNTVLAVLRSHESTETACARAGIGVADFRRARDEYLRAKLAPPREELSAGVGAPVEIVRDRWGIPHVFAGSERDALFGLGYAMGRDRLWQLDYLRREALGTLAELIGPAGHDDDLRMRTIGIAGIAAAQVDRLDGATRDLLEGFVAGINLAMAAQRENLPIELELLEYAPEPWTARDTVALLRGLWWQLTGRLENVVAAEAAERQLDERLYAAFMTPELPGERIVSAGEFVPPADLAPRPPLAPFGIGDATGSNNWAVAAERSTTGAALLASDPHLPFVHPSDLYEAHLSWRGHDVVGAHWVGAPGAQFGHNGRIAWGLTNNASSTRDLYLEEVNPANSGKYRRDGRWVPFQVRTVEIAVRGEAPRRHELRATDIGPLMNATVASVEEGGDPPLSMRWVGAEPLDDLRSLLAVQRATDWRSFRAALADWSLPAFNWTYADRAGTIGYQMTGRVPLRGRVVRGYRRADEPADRWTGYVPYDALPRLERPRRGWAASANNRVAADDYPYPFYGAWAGGNRATRIRQRFEAVEKISPGESRDVQNDVYLIRAARMAPGFASALRTAGEAELAGLLDGWDYRYTLESSAATLFEACAHFWAERVRGARFPDRLAGLLHGSGLALGARLLEGESIAWFEKTTVEAELIEAVRSAADFFRSRGRPTWGEVHTITFAHPLSVSRPAFAEVADVGPAPVVGAADTVRNAAGAFGQGFRIASGAEYRLLVDFAASPIGSAISTLGQSGQPGSPHFADQLEDWVAGGYHPLLVDRTAIDREATARARISPG